MNVLRNVDRDRFRFDFMVYTADHCSYDDEIQALGSTILRCAPPAKAARHARELARLLSTQGPYDAIHVHGSSDIGYTLRTAARAGIPIRVAHSHNNSEERRRRLRSYAYRVATRHWMVTHMTVGLGCSRAACAYLFGGQWRSDPRCRILYYGLDWEPFRADTDRPPGASSGVRATRTALGLPQDALVIGHVGRFAPQKNHGFWLQIAECIAARRDDATFVLVGDGELRPAFEEQVRQRGLQDRFVFTGVRSDVAQMMQAMDVFLFPSQFEGLGIVLLEAQASGLPCVVSDVVPPEAMVIEDQVSRLALEASPATWAEEVLRAAARDKDRDRHAAWEAVARSPFSLPYCIDRLEEIYGGTRADCGTQCDRRML
jgi:glycosyltransferase involved in cell wall biosynthesis